MTMLSEFPAVRSIRGRQRRGLKSKNPASDAVRREREEEWR